MNDHSRRRVAELERENAELRQRLDAIQHRQHLLQAVVDGTTDAVFVKDLQGRYLLANAATSGFVGKPVAEIIGRDDKSLFSPETAGRIMEFDRLVMESGTTQSVEEIGTAAGQTRIYHSTKGPYRDEQGRAIGVIGIARDVTEQKQAEHQLRASEERFATIFRSSPLGACVTTLEEGTFLDANSAFLRQENLTLGDILGQTALDLGYWRDRNERQNVVQILKETGFVINWEMSHRLKDGTITHSLRSLERITLDGQDCILTMLTDITDRKAAEQKVSASAACFRALIEHSFDAVALLSHDGTLLYGSPSATRITGRASHEWIGKCAFDQIHPDDLQRAKDAFAELLSKPEFTQRSQFRYRHNDTSWIWLEVTAKNLLAEPAVQAVVVNYRDITDHKRSEKHLELRRAELQLIFDSVPALIFYKDTQGRFVRVNEAFAKQRGITKDRIVGKTAAELGSPYAEQYAAQEQSIVRTGQPMRKIIERMHTNYGDRWMETDKIPLRGEDGRIIGVIGFSIDITEGKHAVEALRASEERFSKIFRHSPDSIALVGLPEGFLIDVNNKFVEHSGYSRDEVLGRTSLDFGLWKCLAERDRFYQLASAPEGVRSFEGTIQTKSGETRVMQFSSDRIELDGRACSIITARDITAQQRAEVALATERHLLRTMADNLPAYVFVKDTAGRYLFVNLSHARQLGLNSEAEMLGKTSFDFFPADIARSFDADDKAVIQTGQPVVEREEQFEIHGKLGWYFTTKVPLHDAQGKITGLVGIALDITSRKQAEAALVEERNLLRTLVDHIPDFIFVKDTQSRQLLNNAANLRLIGARTDAEVVGKTVFDLYPREQAQRYYDEDQRVMRSGQAQINQEESVLDQDGHEYWMLSSKVPLRDINGKCIGLVGIKRDITEHRRANAELAASRECLEVLAGQLIATQESERRNLARELHDEIGQSLTVAKMNVQAVQNQAVGTAAQPRLAETIAILETTLSQVRDLALQLRPSLLDDLGLLPALRWHVDMQAKRAGFTARFDADPLEGRLAPEIEIASFRIVQEAITNVIRHAHATNVWVEMRNESEGLHFSIRDDGKGFDVPAARQHAVTGASLGLLSMKERATLSAGWLAVESAPGQGTTVEFWLPHRVRQ